MFPQKELLAPHYLEPQIGCHVGLIQSFHEPARKISSRSQLYCSPLLILSLPHNANSYYATVEYRLHIDYTLTISLTGLPGKWRVWLSKSPVFKWYGLELAFEVLFYVCVDTLISLSDPTPSASVSPAVDWE